jgi:hypothetical protein
MTIANDRETTAGKSTYIQNEYYPQQKCTVIYRCTVTTASQSTIMI